MRADFTRMGLAMCVSLTALMSGSAWAQEKQQDATVQPDEAIASKSAVHRATSSEKAANVEHMTVRGQKGATIASSATKSNTPLIETAQSVTVVTRNEMDIRGVLTLNQAIRYAAGITPDLRGGVGTRYDLFQLRGFTIPEFLDGLRLQDSPTGYAIAQIDTSRLERLEILKGPASALYGQSSPGGLVALQSKTPLDKASYGSVNATGGMFDLYRVDADMGGYATKDGSIRYRVYGTVNGQHTQLTRTGSRRFSISPTVSFGGNGPDTLTLIGNYQYDPEAGTYGGVPLEGSLKPAPFGGYLPRNFYDGDARFEKFNRKHGAFTYIYTHRFNNDWSFSTRGRYDDLSTQYRSVYNAGYWDADGMLPRYGFGTTEHTRNLAFDSGFHGKLRTGPFVHMLMAGFDYQQQWANETAGQSNAPDLNVFAPNYDMGIDPLETYARYKVDSHQIGAYGQDEIHWGGLILTGSIRNDWFRSRQIEYLSDSNSKQSPSQITWRASGLYHFKFGLAPYISYATSFQPQTGVVLETSGSTHQANPSIGKQLEGGLKYQLPGTPILLTAAGFHIEQTNVLVSIPNSIYNTQQGLVHSDGFEFEAHMDSWHNLTVDAAVSVQRVHDDSTGKPLIQSGRGNASLFGFYTVPGGRLRSLGFGAGMRYSASAYGGEASYGSANVPQYALFDASLRYDLVNVSRSLKGWTVGANVRNLFDKNYVTNCLAYAAYGQAFCYYGERRNAQATLGFAW
ncbi:MULTISPECIES: TonB-dependent siderophore receptor [Asaia]|uniref:Ferric siderophore receptor n=2 Tax=Asaia TaxID=91914 RepID=A0ABQ1LMZ0_9PROT|nr:MULTISPECIES: TonB-dependent siderophore receptor [Asaia]GBR05787.1 TonB-dependent receptor [Asaia siamensis NRIC 0323]GBR17405.1 TonB-dependent receptor [Asaia spathodeae NBRC 105894]GGC27018.1 ferric siderophore receptor [Asaia siamensis]